MTDLLPHLERRERRISADANPTSARRAAIAAFALVIAAAAIGFAVLAFQPPVTLADTNSSPLSVNGDIYFSVGGGEVGVSYEAVSPDGTHQRTILPVDPTHVGWPQFGELAWSPDGTKIAFVSRLEGHVGMFTANSDGSDIVLLDADPTASWPSWSPDGTKIAFSSARGDTSLDTCPPGDFVAGGVSCPSDIYVMNTDGSGVRRLTSDPVPEFGPAWSPDGSQIAFTRQGEGSDLSTNVAVMKADGSELRRVASTPGGSDFRPSWSPDGSSLVYASIRNEDWGIYVTDLATGQERGLITPVPASVDDPVWSPDGMQIAYSSSYVDLMIMNADGSASRLVAHDPNDAGRIDDIAWRSLVPGATATPASTAANGLIAFSGGPFGGPQILVTQADGSSPVAITAGGAQGTPEHPFPAWEPAWSLDGSQIAFRGFWGHGETSDLFVMNAVGSNVRQLTRDANVTDPAWSPDGTTIAVSGFDGIYTIAAAGSDLRRITPTSTQWHNHPSWSPDGTRIAYDMFVQGVDQIFIVAVDGTGEQQITDLPDGASAPSWSPDTTSIVFSGEQSGAADIYLMNADGTDVRPVTTCDPPDCTSDLHPTWAPDGSRVAFDRASTGGTNIYTVQPDGSDPTLMARDGFDPAWQPIPPTSVASSLPASPIKAEITQTIDTGLRFPESVIVADGGVWVVTRHATTEGGDLLRLDPGTGDVVARISLPSTPGWEFGGTGITAGLGVWIAAGGLDQHSPTVLYRIDPATNTLAETIDVGAGSAADVWVDDTGIWVLAFADSGDALWLYHLDQTTHVVVSRTVIPADWSNTVVGAGGWIWVLGNTDNSDGAPPGTLFRIDPTSSTIVDRSDPAGGESFFLSVSADQLWFFKNDGLYALEASTGNEVVGPIDLPDRCCSGLVPDETGGVWVISGFGAAQKGVWHVSADGIVDRYSDGNPGELADGIGAAFDPSTTSVWIVHYEDTVSRLQITPVE